MAKIDDSVQKEWIKNLWMNYNKQGVENESLWSRVSEVVSAFKGELLMQRDNRRMKPDSVPVGVDCTLSPVPPTSVNSQPRNEFCASGITATILPAEPPVKRVVCSPDLPVYPLVAARPLAEEVVVDSSTTQAPSSQGMLQKIYRCTICSEGFNQKVSLTAHLKTHSKESEDPYQCNCCGKTFAVPARLTRHYRTHTGEKPYQCEFCNKSFSVKENLSVHKRIHTKERPYKCDVCARAFEHSGKLHRHMRIHTGERPHKCNYCSKTFIQSGQLVIHLRTHTGEKPYVCKCCNKGFTCSKQLKVHTRTHTGEKPYACDICGKSFGYNHVLKLHQVAHFGEKVYKCTICKQTFTSKKSMETHIKMAHSDSNAGRNGPEGESSCASSTSDKENNLQYPPRTPADRGPAAGASLSSPLPERDRERAAAYEGFAGAANATAAATATAIECADTGDSKIFTGAPAYYARLTPAHPQGGLTTLLAVAASANEELVAAAAAVATTNYHNEQPPPHSHPSKFQIPAAAGAHYYPVASPSSYSDSSRSSLSPKLEIVEPAEETSLYILPDYGVTARDLPTPTGASAAAAAGSSVIIHVPYMDGLTPSSSSSTSPVPSSPDNVVKEEMSLPPRKRTKTIQRAMEEDKMEDTSVRYTVIQYAKAS